MKNIELVYKGQIYSIRNNWESMKSDVYLRLVHNIILMSKGELSPGELRIRYLCDLMDWDIHKFRDEEAVANIACISEQLTFLFTISYPDNDILDKLSPEERKLCKIIDPYHLQVPHAEELKKLDYKYTLNLCFCAQLMPCLVIDGSKYNGYRIDIRYHVLTCSLSALQYIEARDLVYAKDDSLPLMAAILYYPGSYDSEGAHKLAEVFSKLPEDTLHAISLNFQAFNNFLFTRTSFSLLTQFRPQPDRPITTDASDALYDLSKDGLGNTEIIEHINVITYLRIIRKKTIDAVKNMHGMGMDYAKISSEIGLPISTIEQIL